MANTSAENLASLLLIPDNGLKSQVGQIVHRQALIAEWGGIPASSKVLELGCGQGDCTIAIADYVGDGGKVDAVDPAPPGYGSPYTVEQAQAHISSGALGTRISWHRALPLDFLPASPPSSPIYDISILAHCLWYFSSPSLITETLQRLSSTSKRIYIAEWSLSSASKQSLPHLLSSLTQSALECRKPESTSNVRTVVSPSAIKKLAEEAGLKLVSEGYVTPHEDVNDGKWEVYAVTADRFVKAVEEKVIDERERATVFALRDAMLRSIEVLEGGRKDVRSMDVWCGVFEKA